MTSYLRVVAFVAIGVLLIPVSRGLAQAADPIVGTWDLNVAKSKFATGTAPKRETRTYDVSGALVKATSSGIGPDGKPMSSNWTIAYDGKDQKISGDPDVDTLTFKRTDPYHAEFTQKKGSKIVTTGTRVISQGGKVMTITSRETTASGQTIEDVAVYEKR